MYTKKPFHCIEASLPGTQVSAQCKNSWRSSTGYWDWAMSK